MRNFSQHTLHNIDTGKYLLSRICTFHHFGKDGTHMDFHFSLRGEEKKTVNILFVTYSFNRLNIDRRPIVMVTRNDVICE